MTQISKAYLQFNPTSRFYGEAPESEDLSFPPLGGDQPYASSYTGCGSSSATLGSQPLPSQMSAELETLCAQLADAHVPEEQKSELLGLTQQLLGVLENSSDDTPLPQVVVDQYLVLQTQVSSVLASASNPWDEIQGLVEEMGTLGGKLDTKLRDTNLSETTKEQLRQLKTELETAKSGLNLNSESNEIDQARRELEKVGAKFEQIAGKLNAQAQKKTDNFCELVANYLQDTDHFSQLQADDKKKYVGKLNDLRDQVKQGDLSLEDAQAKFDGYKTDLTDLNKIGALCKQVEDFTAAKDTFSGLTQDQKDALVKKFKDFETKVRDGKISLDEAKSQFKDLQGEIKKQVKDDEETKKLKDKYQGVAALVPREGYGVDRAVSLTDDISMAIRGGSWDQVRANLYDLKHNHEQEMDNAMRQFAGTIFYGACHENLKDAKKMLSLIPKDILNEMADLLLGCGEVDANDYSEESAKKLKSFYYGTGRQTAELFREVAAEKEDDKKE